MSFNVIVIPEDDRLDTYILTPVLKAALAYVGKPSAAERIRDAQHVDGRTAHPEVEVWGLAGCPRSLLDDSWETIRAHRDPKEAYFDPAAKALGVHRGPGRGREHIGRLAGAAYRRVRQQCPELQEIEEIFRRATS